MYQYLQPILLAAILLFHSSSINAANNNDQKYTFAVIANQDDLSISRLTSFYGINVDYLHNIAKALDIQFNLISYGDIESILNDVEQGKVDAALGFSYTEERAERFLFSKPLFESTVAQWFSDPQLASLPPRQLQWACVDQSVHCTHLHSQHSEAITPFANFPEAMEGVLKGKAQAIIGSFISISEYLDRHDITSGVMSIPRELKPEKLRLITSTSNQQLVDKFNQVLSWEQQGLNVRSIASRNRYHVVDKLLSEFRVNNDTVVTYSTGSSAYPFFYGQSDSDYDGFLVDLFELLTSRSGLSFEYRLHEQSQGDLAGFTADLVPVAYTSEPMSNGWYMTKPFLSTNFVSLELASVFPTPTTGNIGVLVSLEQQGVIHLESWRNHSITRFDDLSSLRLALERGEIEVAYIPEDVAHNYVANGIDDNFELGNKNTLSISFAFAVSPSNPELVSVMNAVIDTIDMNEVQKLYRYYQQFNLSYGYTQLQVVVLFVGAATLFTVLLILVFIGRNNLKFKISLAQSLAHQEEKEKHWLQEIIEQISSLVFIHDETNRQVMTNCSRFQSGDCRRCTLTSKQSQQRLVDNAEELHQVFNDNPINDEHLIDQCALDAKHVKRERKKIHSGSNDKTFVITVLQDVSAQKMREESLAKARQEAISAVVAREQFLATMSHELRTPIAGVHGLLDLLGHKLNDKPLIDLVVQARHSTTHLNHLIDEILDFSKLESGDVVPTPTHIDIISLVCASIRAFEVRAQDKGLPLHVIFPPTPTQYVLIDATKITQVISNLLSNAIKFTHQGGIKIDVEISDTELSMSVSDTGIGMSEAQKLDVLKPFTQADNSISREYGGTGLGLTIVDRIVAAMGGQLSIESTINLGTTVTVSVPFRLGENHPIVWPETVAFDTMSHANKLWCDLWKVPLLPVSSMSSMDVHDAPPLSFTDLETKYPDLFFKKLRMNQQHGDNIDSPVLTLRGKVLVAEDNALNQAILRMQLTELGVDFVITNNGLEAKAQLCQPHSFDLLLTDFHMPKMDGLTLTRELRKHERHKSLPIIGLTADDPFIATSKSRSSGMNSVINKPYSLETLQQSIAPYLTEPVTTPNWLETFDCDERFAIAQVFVESVSSDLNLLSNTPSESEADKALHRLKGGLASVSLEALTLLASNTEQATGTSRQDLLSELIVSVQRELANTTHWINHHA